MKKLAPVSSVWRDLGFDPKPYLSAEKTIRFAKVFEERNMAMPAMPTMRGFAIDGQEKTLSEWTPSYTILRDAVEATDSAIILPGDDEFGEPDVSGGTQLTRWKRSSARITRLQRNAIIRFWEWQASQVLLYGRMTLESEQYDRVLLDFGRDPGHTIELGSGARWGDSGVDIMDLLEDWIDIVGVHDDGGHIERIIMGSKAWKAFRTAAIDDKRLHRDIKQTQTMEFDLGVLSSKPLTYMGRLNSGVEVYRYKDYYHLNGQRVDYMDSRDVLLTCNRSVIGGQRCFGAIQSQRASFQSRPIFSRMYDDNETDQTIIKSVSSPLMVPRSINATLRARVVA